MALLDWLLGKDKDKPAKRGRDQAPPQTPEWRTETARPKPPSTAPPLPRPVITAPAPPLSTRVGSSAQWVPAGHRVKLHGYEIPGGMLYVGRGLRTSMGVVEPALIDPELKVNAKRPAPPDQDLGYWPSYSERTPEQRGTYLAWLAGGRRDPSVAIGYAFLFMYGLERRVLVDILAHPRLESELPVIRAEMVELLRLFGPRSASFQGYATSFIDLIDVALAQDSTHRLPPASLNPDRWSVPVTLRIELGSRAVQGSPVPPGLALAWAWYLPDHSPRTAAVRCREEFAQLFAIRYEQKYGGGLFVRPGKARIEFAYSPASAGLRQQTMKLPDVPDVFEQKVPGRKLIALFDAVTTELDTYSRWLGRNPTAAGSLAAVAMLPPDLVTKATTAVQPLRNWADRHLVQRSATLIWGSELVTMWPSAASDKLAKAEAVSLAQLLGTLGYGIEPDVRFGGSPLAADARLVLFRLPPDAPHAATPAYVAATTLVHLAKAVSMADGEVSPEEMDYLGEHLETSLHLVPAEKARLHAHLMWLSTTGIKLTGLKDRLAALDPGRRREIGSLLISIAAADGVVSPAEVTILTKVYRLLGLDPALVTSQLHSSLTGQRPAPATDPVVVRPGGVAEPGYRIPPPRRQEAKEPALVVPAFVLDDRAIERKLVDTAEVAALLGNLFVDAEEEMLSPTVPAPTEQAGAGQALPIIAGLDGAHSLLLRALTKRAEWNRAEFEELAAEYHLMPDGALDRLNEAAFDATDEPVIEGDEVLTINRGVVEQLLA